MRKDDPETDPAASLALPGITLAAAPLSRGPRTAIYRGWDSVHRCEVIVKVQTVTGDQVAADRFRREAEVMQRVRHPNIVALYQFHDNNPSALVMEYVPGRTLEELVAQDGQLDTARAASLIEEVAAALDCIHTQGIIHRDVKPSNILIPKHGPTRLSDFGVAHVDEITPLTVMGDVLGTIEYASPEQVTGNETPDARSDVYSLAAVAYFALAGVPPFRAADSSTQAQLSVMHRQVFAEPEPLQSHRANLTPGINAAVLRGLAKAPDARYPSAGQLAAALRSAVEAASGVPERSAMAAASRRTGALVGTLAGATLLVFGAVAVHEMHQPVPLSGPAWKSKGKTVAAIVPPAAPPPHSAAAVPPKSATSTRRLAAAPKPVRVAVADSRQERVASRPAPTPVSKKMPVTERPKYRRHPNVVATATVPARVSPAMTAKPLRRIAGRIKPENAPRQAWLAVYASQIGQTMQLANVPARAVYVDGHLVSSLAAGGWAALPAGKHLISYVPPAQSGFSRNPGLWVTLAPGAHVRRQILLPVAPNNSTRLVAARPPVAVIPTAPPVSKPLAVAAIPTAVGWYTVSGWAAKAQGENKPDLVRASAQWVKVDGQPVPALARGDWAELPAGKHSVTFQPALGLGVGPKTWDIELTGQGHLQQQVPLPPAASTSVGWYTVSGWMAMQSSGQKPNLVRTSAQWVKVDGQPVLPLAMGNWAELPSGKHIITFQPTVGMAVSPKTWDIDLAPQAHLDQKVPLPALDAPSAAPVGGRS
ncbi:MAG: serine/threonine protein kinase [Armatimonadota bacterium]|nr:serine/threonine protein kinase [Armatimonadota bacterium]